MKSQSPQPTELFVSRPVTAAVLPTTESCVRHAPDNVESDAFQAVVIEKQDPPTGASEFMKVVPSGVNVGCTPSATISILGEPEVVEQDGEITWDTYNQRKGDWRKYWLRFRSGKLEMINI